VHPPRKPRARRLPGNVLTWLTSLALCGTLLPRAASAADDKGGGMPTFSEPEQDNGIERDAAPDWRTGHIYLIPTFALAGPAGLVAANTPTTQVANLGYTYGGIIGVGVGRYGSVQIFGDRSIFTSPETCNIGCGGSSYSFGAGVTYHLAQGIAVDPWGSFGMGYRYSLFNVIAPNATTINGTSYASGVLVPQAFKGFDVARIAFGGDFYPVPWFGLGPFVEVDAGANLQRPVPLVALPPNTLDTPRAYAFFQVGIRVAFDPMRRASAFPRGQTGALPTSAPGM
jgi:hypothetical protein